MYVCVFDGDWLEVSAPETRAALRASSFVRLPVHLGVYTIREVVRPHPSLPSYYRLTEIVNPVLPGATEEIAFVEYCFRPVRDTSIDQFLGMLRPAPTRPREKERA